MTGTTRETALTGRETGERDSGPTSKGLGRQSGGWGLGVSGSVSGDNGQTIGPNSDKQKHGRRRQCDP